jgi:putative SbcD/Mre11-related phosphoesterase
MAQYEFIGKTVFFPKEGILAVGDLHIGYEYSLIQSGILVPERQVEEIKSELKDIFKKVKSTNKNLNKIVFIGDIKHSFSYEWVEKNYFKEILSFLKEHFKEEDIILIKGNHDTIDYTFGDKLQSYYINETLAFLHGHEMHEEAFEKEVKTVVMGHIHPSVILSDKETTKKERYKCFLVGKYKSKEVIILPSFLSTHEGAPVNDYDYSYEDFFSIVPKKYLLNFKVFAIGEDEIYDFGEILNLTKK